MNERIIWIDYLRGICMLMILWFHTEMYYAGRDVLPYNLYVANALTTFYFISGYLFYAEKKFSWNRKLHSIFRGIVLPYFFFTIILAIPKALMNDLPIHQVLLKILLGNGSWFVSSLIVAEIAFTFVLIIKSKCIIYIVQITCLFLAYLLTDTNISMRHNYWNFHNALIGMFFLCLGYEYHQHEKCFQIFHRLSQLLLLLIAFITIKIYVIYSGTSLLVEPVNISNYPLFFVDTIIGILLFIAIAKRLSHLPWLIWTGRHSLVYYFFCGAVPMTVAKGLTLLHIPYNNHYYLIPIAFVLVYIITTAITWLAYHYLPFSSTPASAQ